MVIYIYLNLFQNQRNLLIIQSIAEEMLNNESKVNPDFLRIRTRFETNGYRYAYEKQVLGDGTQVDRSR